MYIYIQRPIHNIKFKKIIYHPKTFKDWDNLKSIT